MNNPGISCGELITRFAGFQYIGNYNFSSMAIKLKVAQMLSKVRTALTEHQKLVTEAQEAFKANENKEEAQKILDKAILELNAVEADLPENTLVSFLSMSDFKPDVDVSKLHLVAPYLLNIKELKPHGEVSLNLQEASQAYLALSAVGTSASKTKNFSMAQLEQLTIMLMTLYSSIFQKETELVVKSLTLSPEQFQVFLKQTNTEKETYPFFKIPMSHLEKLTDVTAEHLSNLLHLLKESDDDSDA